MRHFLRVTLALLLVSGVLLADSPETGVVTGKVTDAQGQGLPGVTVTLSGERGSQSIISADGGSYRFALLVPGSYVVKAELEGFQSAEGVANVTAGSKQELVLKLLLGTAEEITVTSESPMVDKYNVTAGSTVSAEIGVQTAGSTRTYYGLINTLPGVASDAENDDIQQTRPSVNGTHFADNAVFIDGVDTTFAKFGGSRVFLPTTAITEVSMEAGGSSAEYGRVIGSQTNVIVKSGTNKYHADALVQHQKVKWGGDYKDQPALEEREVSPLPRNFLQRSALEEEGDSTGLELSVGGPIKRDKAWFFLGWSDFDDNYVEKLLGGDPVDTSLKNEARILKANFQPGASHQLSASFIDTPASRVYFNPETFDYWVPTPHVVDGDLATLNWNWSVNQNFFLETKIAAQTSTEHKQLACGSVDISVCLALKQQDRGPDGEGPLRFPSSADHPFLPPEALGEHYPGDNYRVYLDTNFISAWHNGWILSDGFGNNDFPRDQANAALTQFAGANHEIKYGIDYQNTKWTGESSRPGLYSGYNFDALSPYGFLNAGTTEPEACGLARPDSEICLFRDYNADFLVSDRGTGDSETEVLAFFVRDRFTIGDHWTFNLGLRAESQTGFNDVRREVFEDEYISPRFSGTFDIKADGRMLLSVNAGRYHALLNQEWIAQHLHDQWNGFEGFRDYLFCDPFDVFLGQNVITTGLIGQCGTNGVGYTAVFRDLRPGGMWDLVDAGVFDAKIEPYYKDEIILGFEWQFTRNWALDAKVIRWELKNMIGSTIQSDVFGRQFGLTANYKNYQQILGLLEQGRIDNGVDPLFAPGVLEAFREGSKDYSALQLQVNRRFAGNWAIYNNITWSETETTGAGAWWNNTNSDYGEDLHVTLTQDMIDDCQQDQLSRVNPVDCNVLSPFLGTSVSTINRLGKDRNADRPIIWNTFGFKTWNIGSQTLTLGGHLTYQTGLPWARTESVSTITLDGGNAANASVDLRLFPLGAGGRRADDEYSLNLSGAWGMPLGRQDLRGELRIEALNVTDQQRQRWVSGRGEVRPVRRDFQRPRQIRASFGIRF